MKSINKSTGEFIVKKSVHSTTNIHERGEQKSKKPITISINLVDDIDNYLVLNTESCKNCDSNKPLERNILNGTNLPSRKSSLHKNKYTQLDDKFKKILREININDTAKFKNKGSFSVSKKNLCTNNLSLLNGSLNLNKDLVHKFERKRFECIDKQKLNFSIDNKNSFLLTPTVKKNNKFKVSSKENSAIPTQQKTKIKDSSFKSNDSKFVLQKYGSILNHQEIEELIKISEVFFLGNIISRHYIETSDYNNQVYTDENGNFILNIKDHISYRYEIISELGTGSFGQAIKCFDHKEKIFCCLKILKNNDEFISQAETEIKILNYLKKAELQDKSNIVQYYENFVFRNHLCFKFEILDLNLYEYIRDREFASLDENLIRKVTKQILYVLVFLKRHNIIHSDIKPENILFKKVDKLEIKVIDFGSSCFTHEKIFTYIQSRFYRAPEVILECEYSSEIDMWSLGCMVAEMCRGYPIFPGESEVDQFNYFLQYLGVPSLEIFSMGNKKSLLFNENNTPLCLPNSKGKIRLPNTKSLTNFLIGSSKNLIDFVKQCLIWDRDKRLKPEEALMHPWILDSLPQKMSKANIKVNNKSNKQRSNLKGSNYISYQKQSQKVQNENNKNGIATKNTSNNTEKYSSPESKII